MVTTIIILYFNKFYASELLIWASGQLYKKISCTAGFEIKKNIQKLMIKFVLQFFDLGKASIEDYLETIKGSFFIIVNQGVLVHVEDQVYVLKSGKISIIFDQIHFCQI
jgi:hypothetical protein